MSEKRVNIALCRSRAKDEVKKEGIKLNVALKHQAKFFGFGSWEELISYHKTNPLDGIENYFLDDIEEKGTDCPWVIMEVQGYPREPMTLDSFFEDSKEGGHLFNLEGIKKVLLLNCEQEQSEKVAKTCGIKPEIQKRSMEDCYREVLAVKEAKKPIEINLSHWDGSHNGLGDWYKEDVLVEALASGRNFTTGWYSCKKEIVSGKITRAEGKLICEASCSDDFDSEGSGEVEITYTQDLDDIRDALSKAWEIAEGNRKENLASVCAPFVVQNPKGEWLDVYIVDLSGWGADCPPGDEYHRFGYQEDDNYNDERGLTKEIRDGLENSLDFSSKVNFNGWSISPFDGGDN